MDVPEREHKSLPHSLKEIHSTPTDRGGWAISFDDPRVGGALTCPAGATMAQAYTNADAYLATHHKGYTL